MRFLIFTLLLLHSMTCFALDPLLSLRVGEAESKLKVIEQAFKKPQIQLDINTLNQFQQQGIFVKNTSNECIDFNEKAINKSADDLELLGAQALSEDPGVTQKRQSLNQNMLSHAQQLASCRLLLLRAHESIDITLSRQQQALASEMLSRSPHLYSNFKNIILNPGQVLKAGVEFISAKGGWDNLRDNASLLLAIIIFALALIWLLKNRLKSRLKQFHPDQEAGFVERLKFSLMSCANRYMPALVISGLLSLYYAYYAFIDSTWLFPGLVLFGLFVYTWMALLIRLTLNPCPPGEGLSGLTAKTSQRLSSRLSLLSKLILLGFLFYSALAIHQFPPQIAALSRNIYLFLLVLNLIWAVWLLRIKTDAGNIVYIRWLIIVGLIACLGADWLGYRNLADHLLSGVVGSIVLWGFTLFIVRLWTDFLNGLDEGRNAWQQRLRKRIGVKDGDYLPGSIWFRFTFAIVVWSVFIITLLKLWGLPDANLISLKETIISGFEVGSVNIVPFKVLSSLLFFAIMLSIVGWLKRRMDKSWLKRSRMDRGSKEAMISLTGYFGVAMALLIALSIAGVELASLALIAGALSVGIGFGLQNIVNNFVSGVILLFERPIKTGDWVVVGGTEGYVKKISIRSTQIQTFDRSDVIVPNSELISTQVTNWMFRDSIGRIVVPIGVAYGSDPEQVKEILLHIAHQHSSIISQSPILPKPWVNFKAFGDSSLDFELRCYIKDADERVRVISGINFELEKALREAAIDIPFPQRDIHLITKSTEKDDILPDS